MGLMSLLHGIKSFINNSMTNKISKVFQSEEKVRVIKNTLSLLILQGSGYILPLILIPYLIRVLGIEYFGLLAFATSTVNILRGFVSYGFDLSGTQLISRHRDDKNKLVEILSSILVVKFSLAIIFFFILSVLLIFVAKFTSHWEIFIFTFLIVFGDVLFPVWFFQGVERMKIITYLQMFYKISFIVFVILLVKNSENYWMVPLLDSIGSIIAGIVALYYIKKNFGVSFSMPTYKEVKFQLENGWHIFISKIAVILYTSVNTFLLGLFTNNVSVGYYSIAEKIYMAIRGLFTPITQALFPFLSKIYAKNKTKYYKIVKKLTGIYFIVLAILSIFTYFFSSDLIELLSGKVVIESVKVLEIFSFALVFAVGTFFTILLVIKSEGKVLSKITFISMIANLILVTPAIYFFGIYGLAYQVLIVQIIHATLQIKSNSEIWAYCESNK